MRSPELSRRDAIIAKGLATRAAKPKLSRAHRDLRNSCIIVDFKAGDSQRELGRRYDLSPTMINLILYRADLVRHEGLLRSERLAEEASHER